MDLERPVNTDPRRGLPSVDRLIQEVAAAAPELPLWAIRSAARMLLQTLREDTAGSPMGPSSIIQGLTVRVALEASRRAKPHPRRVLNATGILLHTNLGRAPLAVSARDAVARAAEGYSSLELDLETGRRGSRLGRLAEKLVLLSGAESAHVVNNNAAALLLALNTLAMGRPVVVSRGELVEIGGSFRVPAVMERAGVRLREIGTTNRTHLSDYRSALAADPAPLLPALILKVHRSNFEQRGFVAEADVSELAELAHAHGIPLVEDLGSGTLVDLADAGLPPEVFVQSRFAKGVDIVCFSGDKLLGGPQAGILLGRRDLIEAMRLNPLARALRVDKLTLAALDATVDLLLEPGRADEIPIVAGLRIAAGVLRDRARRLHAALEAIVPASISLELARSEGAVGGGSLPELRLEGHAVVLRGPGLAALVEGLRAAPVPVVARLFDEGLWLDVRTLTDDELPLVCAAFAHALR